MCFLLVVVFYYKIDKLLVASLGIWIRRNVLQKVWIGKLIDDYLDDATIMST